MERKQIQTLYEKSEYPWILLSETPIREKLPDILKNFLKSGTVNRSIKKFLSPIFLKLPPIYSGPVFLWNRNRTRVFLKIQDGCDSFCTFCIIPFARGKSRSLKINDIVCKANNLTEQEDIKEIVLTGVHIGDYQDEEKDLGDLIQALLSKTQIKKDSFEQSGACGNYR